MDALGNPERWGHTCSFHINNVLIGHLRSLIHRDSVGIYFLSELVLSGMVLTAARHMPCH